MTCQMPMVEQGRHLLLMVQQQLMLADQERKDEDE